MNTQLKTARLVAAMFGALLVSTVAVGAAIAPATQVSSQIA